MITTAELHRIASAEGLRFDQTEKDYVILWLLYGLSQPNFFLKRWLLKGGTCLRHCYYPGYRFSEDIDFTCQLEVDGLDSARKLLNQITAWVQENSGIFTATKTPLTIPGDFQIEIPVEYSRGGSRRQKLPNVKIHLTFDEPILRNVTIRSVKPPYSDLPVFEIACYSIEEIVAEKMRALLQQQVKWPRPRDLYDLWFILCRSDERFQKENLKDLFVQKCRTRQIQPDADSLVSENLKEWNKGSWENILKPLMKTVPDFNEVWKEWTTVLPEII